jgi:hypothetical protein
MDMVFLLLFPFFVVVGNLYRSHVWPNALQESRRAVWNNSDKLTAPRNHVGELDGRDTKDARMVKSADTADLKSADPYQVVGVQVPLRAP